MTEKLYYLMDLERTLVSGIPCYWKQNKYGYTYNLAYAGLFNEDLANEIVKNDLDEKTVKIPQKLTHDVLGNIIYETD